MIVLFYQLYNPDIWVGQSLEVNQGQPFNVL